MPNDNYVVFARTLHIGRMYFNTILRDVNRQQVSFVCVRQNTLLGISGYKILLGYGWRYYDNKEWISTIEHMIVYRDCRVIGDFNHITPDERSRFKTLRAIKQYSPYDYANRECNEILTRNDLLIID